MTPEQITQLGIASIFAIGCVQLFLRLQLSQSDFLKYLMDQNAELRKQNAQLSEQNKLLAISLFSGNQDAMRAYNALNKSSVQSATNINQSPITDLMDK